jgi:quinol monooxygenase YgiN
MQLNKSILRIFDVRAKEGKVDLLKQKLSDTSVSVVKGKPGNIGYFFGENLSTNENDLVFISIWKNLESIKSHFGESWEQSYLPEGYEEVIESCSIKHIEFDGRLDL